MSLLSAGHVTIDGTCKADTTHFQIIPTREACVTKSDVRRMSAYSHCHKAVCQLPAAIQVTDSESPDSFLFLVSISRGRRSFHCLWQRSPSLADDSALPWLRAPPPRPSLLAPDRLRVPSACHGIALPSHGLWHGQRCRRVTNSTATFGMMLTSHVTFITALLTFLPDMILTQEPNYYWNDEVTTTNLPPDSTSTEDSLVGDHARPFTITSFDAILTPVFIVSCEICNSPNVVVFPLESTGPRINFTIRKGKPPLWKYSIPLSPDLIRLSGKRR